MICEWISGIKKYESIPIVMQPGRDAVLRCGVHVGKKMENALKNVVGGLGEKMARV